MKFIKTFNQTEQYSEYNMDIQDLSLEGKLTFNLTPFVTEGLTVFLNPVPYSGTGNWNNTAPSATTPSPAYASDYGGSITYNSPYSFTLLNNTGETNYTNGAGWSLTSVAGRTSFTTANNYTIEIWFKKSATDSVSRTLLSKWDMDNSKGYPYNITVTPNFATCNCKADAAAGGVYMAGVNCYNLIPYEWNQIAIVYDWTNEKVYGYTNGVVSGPVDDSSLVKGKVISNNLNATIGLQQLYSPTIYGFNGEIGIIRMYNRALTPGQIFQNFVCDRGNYGI